MANLQDNPFFAAFSSADASAPVTPAAPSADASDFIARIRGAESNNAPDSSTITNPKSGAMGAMQVMPATSRDPGFGIKPSNGTPEDNVRVGNEYAAQMLQRYNGNQAHAAAAYNWGPGNVDKWIAAGADPAKLPAETRGYVAKVAGLQQVPTFGAQPQQQASAPVQQVPDSLKGNPFAESFFGSDVVGGKRSDTAAVSVSGSPVSQAVQPSQQQEDNTYLGRSIRDAKTFLSHPLDGIYSAAAGAGNELWRVGARAEHAIGAGLSGVGLTGAGNALQGNADSIYDSANRRDRATPQPAMAVGGAMLPQAGIAVAAPATIPAQALVAGTLGASDAAMNGGSGLDIGIGGATNAALGAFGQALGPLASTAYRGARNAMTALSPEASAAARAAGAVEGDIGNVVSNLRANADSPIAGVQRTAAEAADNTGITGLQRGQSVRDTAFANRANENNAARQSATRAAVGDLDADTAAFVQAQADRVAAGQAELPPISQAQADAMQTPVYGQAISDARKAASNAAAGGRTAFNAQADAVQSDLRQGIADVAGTPESLAAMRAQRGATAADDFLSTHVGIRADDPKFQALLQKPAMKSAMNQASIDAQNSGGSLFATAANRAKTNLGGSAPQPVQYVSGRGLTLAKQALDDQIGAAARAGESGKVANLMGVKRDLVGFLDQNIPEYGAARDAYAKASGPIDALQTLQDSLRSAVNPVDGTVNAGALKGAIDRILREQAKPGIRAADKVSSDQLAALVDLSKRAASAERNMVGLSGQGQEDLRVALASRAGRNDQAAAAAKDSFDQYLASQSPNYAEYTRGAATTGRDIESRGILRDFANKVDFNANDASGGPQIAYNQARSSLLDKGLMGDAGVYAGNLLDDLKRATTAAAPVGPAGSQTTTNAAGLLALLMQGGGLGNAATGATAGAGIFHALSSGTLEGTGIAVGALVGKAALNRITSNLAARTDKQLSNLLLDPKKLASALEKFAKTDAEKKAATELIKQRVAASGRVGARVVANFEADREANRRHKETSAAATR
ncbi:lytic transglycosylase domain-containing protein [Caballeronia sp. GAFFF2]|uniref:lytic transglycosylase domain-containing protein n=1 Tax=Caballeronia sp. GAFFF2 TaxID=2921741 RepID=UPI0020279BE7|nr:lytic transglycosylase domain-containing protein [Caballeronia sp. GAFFF2]